MNAAELFEMIAETARSYMKVMSGPVAPADQVVSWDADRKFVIVIARDQAAEKLLDHIKPQESV